MHRRRTHILINKPFQIRFSLYNCTWIFAATIAYPWIIYSLFNYFVNYLALDPAGPTVDAILKTRNSVILLLIALQLCTMLIIFGLSVFISHRIAGPLYKLQQFMKKVEDGNYSEELHFRQHDHFKELAESFNRMLAGLRKRSGS